MNPRDLVRLARDLQQKSLTDVEAELRRRHLDAETRLQVKLEMTAQAGPSHPRGVRLVAVGELATDTAAYQRHQEARPRSEIDRLLDRVEVDRQHQYTEHELGALLDQAGITEPEQRIALRLECRAQGLTRDVSEADRLLRALNIEGPVDLLQLEQTMDQRGYLPSIKTVIKSECQQRGWLKGGSNRSMRAAAARGTRLVDRHTGQPISLKSYPV